MEDPDLFDSFLIANEVIFKLLSNVEEHYFNQDIKQKALKFAIANTIETLFAVTESFFIRTDPGIEPLDTELPEPIPGNPETWMRSAVPVHKRFVQKVDPQESNLLVENKSSVSFKTSYYRSNTLQRLVKKPSKILEAPRAEPINLPVQLISDSEEFMRLKKERDYNRKQEETARLEALKKEDENKRKLLAKQLNGKTKNFTYDFNGKILLVNPAKIENEMVETVSFKINEEEKIEEKPRSLPRTGQTNRVLEKKKMLDPIIEKPLKHVFSASVLDHLRLAPGVNFGGTVVKKAGNPGRSTDLINKKLPKKVELAPIVSKEPELRPKKHRIFETLSGSVSSLPVMNEKTDFVKEKKKKTNQIKQYSRDMIKSDHLSDYERFNVAILTDTNWGKNPPFRSVKVPARVPKAASAKDRWEIYGFLGKKPKDEPFMSTDELIQITLAKKKPRDRPYIEKVEKKTKQPAPPLGQTMKLDI